eukprot:scaffold74604_cov30-Tisochrysis_lutea.AAC.1
MRVPHPRGNSNGRLVVCAGWSQAEPRRRCGEERRIQKTLARASSRALPVRVVLPFDLAARAARRKGRRRATPSARTARRQPRLNFF